MDDLSAAVLDTVVVCSDVTVGRLGAEELHDVSCRVEAGQHIALVGPGGSGKTTLLEVLGGIERPADGTITWPALGERTRWRPGMVMASFAGSTLVGGLDVEENVALPMILAGVPEPQARTWAAGELRRLGLGHLGADIPEDLSPSQVHLVSLARALAAAPRLLLADEPTGGLDDQAADQVLTVLLRRCRALGAALVLATRDQQVADRLPHQWPIRDGRLCVAAQVQP